MFNFDTNEESPALPNSVEVSVNLVDSGPVDDGSSTGSITPDEGKSEHIYDSGHSWLRQWRHWPFALAVALTMSLDLALALAPCPGTCPGAGSGACSCSGSDKLFNYFLLYDRWK